MRIIHCHEYYVRMTLICLDGANYRRDRLPLKGVQRPQSFAFVCFCFYEFHTVSYSWLSLKLWEASHWLHAKNAGLATPFKRISWFAGSFICHIVVSQRAGYHEFEQVSCHSKWFSKTKSWHANMGVPLFKDRNVGMHSAFRVWACVGQLLGLILFEYGSFFGRFSSNTWRCCRKLQKSLEVGNLPSKLVTRR